MDNLLFALLLLSGILWNKQVWLPEKSSILLLLFFRVKALLFCGHHLGYLIQTGESRQLFIWWMLQALWRLAFKFGVVKRFRTRLCWTSMQLLGEFICGILEFISRVLLVVNSIKGEGNILVHGLKVTRLFLIVLLQGPKHLLYSVSLVLIINHIVHCFENLFIINFSPRGGTFNDPLYLL
jgi:hypothetical protein